MTTVTPLALPEVLLITPRRHGDARGWFSETWSRRTLSALGIDAASPTRGRWVSARLTAEGGEQLFVPRGFAHGYCTLCDDVMLAYKVDGDYAPQAEGGVVWNDPALAIDWPIGADAAILSDKDRVLLRLSNLPDPAF